MITQSVAVTSTITTTYGYDPDGNTVQMTTQTTDATQPGVVQTHLHTASYNAADWLTSSRDDGAGTSYGYDAAGQERTQTVLTGTALSVRGLDCTIGSHRRRATGSRRKCATRR